LLRGSGQQGPFAQLIYEVTAVKATPGFLASEFE
jgi:hypothetical protein